MKNTIKWSLRLAIIAFVLLNISAAFHGYKFTHFAKYTEPKSEMDELNTLEKFSVLFMGISNPRPTTGRYPKSTYQEVEIKGDGCTLSAWEFPQDSAKGHVLFFHGFSTEKSSQLEKARLVQQMGYSTMLVDFRGSGGSSDNVTTIGYKEADDVIASLDYAKSQGHRNLFLFGSSMGSAAILKAVSENDLGVKGIIVECPFGTLLQAAQNRFEVMGVPTFPASQLLVFWSGIENGFWAFGHKPTEYSKSIDTPTLLIYGEKDHRVKRSEIDEIYKNLPGEKELLLFPKAGHGDYLKTDEAEWKSRVEHFLERQ